MEGFEKGGAPSSRLTEKAARSNCFRVYLPKDLSDEELTALVKDAIAESGPTTKQQTGAVMKIASAKAAGRAGWQGAQRRGPEATCLTWAVEGSERSS